MNAKLIIPNEAYLPSYLEACREYRRAGDALPKMFPDPDTLAAQGTAIFTRFEDERAGRNLPEGYVPASMFWLVEGDAFIGFGSIRHRLTPALERFGGYIGYAVRPSKWNMGYGTLQLNLLLREARTLGILKALVTCNDDNIGSYRVMEKNGGVYQDTIDNVIDGKPIRTRRYWFNLDDEAIPPCF